MNYTINLTLPAEQDIREVMDYIRFELNNLTAARSLRILLKSKIQNLPYFPKQYPLVDDAVLLQQQIRYIPVDNYLVFYKIDEEKAEIQILRFLYAKSNWLKILKVNQQNLSYPEGSLFEKHYINEEQEKF